MSLFTEKYLPLNLDEMFFHKDISQKLKKLVQNDNVPHLLIYGKNNSGKSTLVNSMLYDIFGKSSKKVKKISLDIKISNTSNTHTIQYTKNVNYIIFNMTHKISYDKYVIKELTNFFIESANINSYISNAKYRIIIIKNAENLSIHAQSFLRRTMEKYTEYCKFILLTQQLCCFIHPIRSRCITLRLSSITYDECLSFSKYILDKEKINYDNDQLVKLVKCCDNIIYDILLILQANIKDNSIDIDFSNIKLSYKEKLSELVENIINGINIKKSIQMKQDIYKQLITNIKTIDIINFIKKDIFNKIDLLNKSDQDKFNIKKDIIEFISECQSQMNTGNKSIFYFELLFIQLSNYFSKQKIK